MKIGIGLPSTIPGTPGPLIMEWARRAEQRGFSSLAIIDRIVFPNYDSLIALAAAGAVTERIGLLTNILVAPARNPITLAKEAASVDQISGGRLTLGLAVGGREDDFQATGQEFKGRGERLDRDLELMHRAWKGEHVTGSPQPVTPRPTRPEGVPILVGGSSETILRRMVKWGTGWTAGGAPLDMVRPFLPRVQNAWKEGGREGQPRMVALGYYGLGPNADEGIAAYIGDYYAFLGPWAQGITQGTPRTPEALQTTIKQFEDAGFDEFIWNPTIPQLAQVDLLADIVL
ncbi:MAG: LLM class flavin-dependent oxidoreductase [Chloroflexota bacterium]|nr:LLM class flavin-dependent oxidoreductase [Chloroflexota bacterium]MDQ5864973.1 LLM class flavin-dependent oxidoreductase [Chloroflexota bacterium]